ncbi:MAG: hypothetical protein ACYC91_05305 [Solirubrobacteraceae bacterium]
MNPLPESNDRSSQETIVALLRHAAVTERAPERLRRQIEAARPVPRARARRRVVLGAGLVSGLAALVLALVLVLPAGTPGGPSLSQAAALGLRGPVSPAPSPDPRAPSARLGAEVQEVYFPNWQRRFGWRAAGSRSDLIGGRRAVTVFYAWRRARLAYSIISAPALAQPHAPMFTLDRIQLRTLELAGRLVVTWRRAGHTCVISAAGVPATVLEHLAASSATPGSAGS